MCSARRPVRQLTVARRGVRCTAPWDTKATDVYINGNRRSRHDRAVRCETCASVQSSFGRSTDRQRTRSADSIIGRTCVCTYVVSAWRFKQTKIQAAPARALPPPPPAGRLSEPDCCMCCVCVVSSCRPPRPLVQTVLCLSGPRCVSACVRVCVCLHSRHFFVSGQLDGSRECRCGLRLEKFRPHFDSAAV